MKGADTIARAIEEEAGVVFGLPGESVLPLYEALEGTAVKNILMRDERSAVHAADGFARASGKVGVCMATHGPGAMNMGLGIATAWKDSIPLLALAGQLPEGTALDTAFQGLDSYRAYEAITKSSSRALDIPGDIARSFSLARSGRPGPVFLEVPMDLMEGTGSPYERLTPERKRPTKEEVDAFIRTLEGAQKSLLLLGGGIISAGAEEEARKFLKITGIPAVTTMMGRGVIPEGDPRCLGVIGTRGTGPANCAMENTDLLVVLGSRMSDRTSKYIPKNLKTFTVNVEGGDSMSDVREFLARGNPLLKDQASNVIGFEDCRRLPLYPWEGKKGASYEAIKNIYRALGDETVVVDPGQYTMWALILKKVSMPRELIFSGSFAPMGFALPAAIGVHFAGKRPVVITGDGSLTMSAHELATVKELGLPITLCVLNNQGYGIIGQRQEDLFGRRSHVDFEGPDFQKLAGAYGIDAARMRPHQVEGELSSALKSDGPFLLEIMVDREAIPMPRRP